MRVIPRPLIAVALAHMSVVGVLWAVQGVRHG